MNIRLPKAQNFIPALLEIGIARLVSLFIGGLDSIQIAAINSRVSMPEISIPLNDNRTRGYKNVNDKLAADHLLLQVVNFETVKNSRARTLESVRCSLVWKAKNSSYALLLCRSVSASVRTMIPVALSYKPAGGIERFLAGWAAPYFSASSFLECALSRLLFGLWCSLPSVGTLQRTEANRAPRCAPILKRLAAPLAGEHIASIAPLGTVCAWRKRLAALLADFMLGNVLYSHSSIIPWRIGVVKCRSN